jgi:hypothetical protein
MVRVGMRIIRAVYNKVLGGAILHRGIVGDSRSQPNKTC